MLATVMNCQHQTCSRGLLSAHSEPWRDTMACLHFFFPITWGRTGLDQLLDMNKATSYLEARNAFAAPKRDSTLASLCVTSLLAMQRNEASYLPPPLDNIFLCKDSPENTKPRPWKSHSKIQGFSPSTLDPLSLKIAFSPPLP